MKPTLTFSMVSGTCVLLVGLTFTLTPTPAQASRPDGYTDDGQPYYYAYPDEGYADEENSDNSGLTMPPDYSMMAPDNEYGYDDSYSEPYTGWGGGIWGWGTPGIPFGQSGFFGNQFRHGKGFDHHDGMHHNFPVHSSMVVPHHNSAVQGAVNNGHVMNGAVRSGGAAHVGGGHGGGGGHR